MSLLDVLFPKRCVQCKKYGSYLCTDCFSSIRFTDIMVCTVCQKLALGGFTHPVCQTRFSIDGVFPSLVYKGVVKKLVYVFKYPSYVTDLQEQLVDLLYEGIIQKEQFFALLTEPSVLIPIPLDAKKFRRRGYNQAKLLADGLARKLDIPVSDCLLRVKQTKAQFALSKEERIKNVADAFAVKYEVTGLARQYRNAFLIDDVVTSGATLQEGAKLLKKAGFVHVWGVTLAHGE